MKHKNGTLFQRILVVVLQRLKVLRGGGLLNERQGNKGQNLKSEKGERIKEKKIVIEYKVISPKERDKGQGSKPSLLFHCLSFSFLRFLFNFI